jgi:hypothetical protein
MTLKLVIFDADPQNVAALESVFRDMKSVSIKSVDTMLYRKPPRGLDVLYLPLTAAEQWGSKPLIHESQILPTTPQDQQNGLPPFIVTGTCLAPGDPRGPIPETRFLLTSVFDEIRAFNNRNEFKLSRIGFWSHNLLTYHLSASLTPLELKAIVVEIIPELLRQ